MLLSSGVFSCANGRGYWEKWKLWCPWRGASLLQMITKTNSDALQGSTFQQLNSLFFRDHTGNKCLLLPFPTACDYSDSNTSNTDCCSALGSGNLPVPGGLSWHFWCQSSAACALDSEHRCSDTLLVWIFHQVNLGQSHPKTQIFVILLSSISLSPHFPSSFEWEAFGSYMTVSRNS